MKKYTSAKTDELNHDALKAREIVHCNNLATKLVHIYITAYICSSYIYDFHIFAVVYSPLGGFI